MMVKSNIAEVYVDSVRKGLRLKSKSFDDEIKMYISACRLDLLNSGIEKEAVSDEDDPLILAVIICYCKSMFGINNTEKMQFDELYTNMKISLKNSSHGRVEDE